MRDIAVARDLVGCIDNYHALVGIVLFWLHDRSPGRKRTRRLIRATAPILEKMVTLGSLPLLRGLAKEGLDLVRELREDADGV